jgi:hypothetical protein
MCDAFFVCFLCCFCWLCSPYDKCE